MLVRASEWWVSKPPLVFLLAFLLLSGHGFSLSSILGLVPLVLAFCFVLNYGYAINDLFDQEEDQRVGKANLATLIGAPRMWAIAAGSAIGGAAFGFVAAGFSGLALTVAAMILPTIYSAPPLRLKERGWLGIVSDALAAHVYPAILALLAASAWYQRENSRFLDAAVVLWSLMAGLRAILLHQTGTVDRDQSAGLTTVVHHYGTDRVARFVLCGIFPIEVASFAAILFETAVGPVFFLIVGPYLLGQIAKTMTGRKRLELSAQGLRRFPLLDYGFCLVWAPIAAAVELATADIRYAVLPPIYIALFWKRMRIDRRLRSLRHLFRRRLADAE